MSHVLVLLADIMTSGVWAELADLQDLELQRLTKLVQATLFHGHADSTITKYGHVLQCWKS